jgi:hypothetical protein
MTVPRIDTPGQIEARALRPEDDVSEAYRVLVSLARGKTGAIPADLLARHVLATTEEADWPVKRAAMEAIVRRAASGKQDRLRIASRPRRSPFGIYPTRRGRSGERPYTTLLGAIDPPRARARRCSRCSRAWRH